MKGNVKEAATFFRHLRPFLVFLFGLAVFRGSVADWYGVPTASMYPNLLIGDRLVSNRLAYDLRLPFSAMTLRHIADPRRGDIVTFVAPDDGMLLVKRIVGVPGDVVAMKDNRLVINGNAASYADAATGRAARRVPGYAGRQRLLEESVLGQTRTILLMPDHKSLREFGPVTVPPGRYLVLGDNRDNSKDSRYMGFIPRDHLTGRVMGVAFSFDADRAYLPRMERVGAVPD